MYGQGFSYANALVLILFDGIIFVFLTITGLRKKIFLSIPECVRAAIPAGLGLFIAFLGLQNAGIIVPSESTCVDLGSFNLLTGNWGEVMPLVVGFVSFLVIVILTKNGVKGAVLCGILCGTVLYYLFGLTVPGFFESQNIMLISPLEAFRQFGTETFGKIFTEGFDFSSFIEQHGSANFVITIATTALAFCLVDMFDTLGTLYGACSRGNLLTEDGDVPNMDKAMLSDAIATVVGSVCGVSTVTTFAESTVGVAEGGRTGLTSIFSAICFFVAMFLSPVAQLIPSCATAAALIYVGVLMVSSVARIDWESFEIGVPAFLTMVMMPFSYNVSYGIAFGMIAYVIIHVFTGKKEEVKMGTWVIAALFIAMLVLTH